MIITRADAADRSDGLSGGRDRGEIIWEGTLCVKNQGNNYATKAYIAALVISLQSHTLHTYRPLSAAQKLLESL